MGDIRIREEKIKEKRKLTSWREFVLQFLSYYSFSLYKKQDGKMTAFAPEYAFNTIDPIEFDNQRDANMKFGMDYDFQRPFFDQFKGLASKISYPRLAARGENPNTEFGHKIMFSKNCYVSFEVTYSENIIYSVNVKDNCYNIFNGMQIGDNSSIIYQAVGVFRSSLVFYSKFVFDSSNIWFSTEMQGCYECIFCNQLENQSYCIHDKQYPKEEYLKLKNEILSQKENFMKSYQGLPSGKNQLACQDTEGTFTIKCNGLENGYFAYNINHGKNVVFAGTAEGNQNFFDVVSSGSPRGNDFYAVAGAGLCDNIFCGIEIIGGANNYYSYFLTDCSYCLGCIGLKNKSFCIFNKEYSKEERYELANRIFEHMDKHGMLGQFFPGWMNPFYFNDTAAYLIDDTFTKEEITKAGYLRRDDEIKVDIPQGAEIVETKDLNNCQGFDKKVEWKIDKEILKKVIKDEKGNYYRIVPMELEFLQKYGLPLPELHRLERIKLGFKFK